MSSVASRSPRPPALWQRLVAWASLGLVIMLNLLAATPQVHAWLHDAPPAAGDHGACDHADPGASSRHDDDASCVVTQFANGQVGCEAIRALVRATLLREVASLPDLVAAPAGRPDLKLPPGCGPPLV